MDFQLLARDVAGMRRAARSIVQSLALIAASALCPDCPPARAARAMVLGEGWWTNLVRVALPFVVITIVLAWVARRIGRIDRTRTRRTP